MPPVEGRGHSGMHVGQVARRVKSTGLKRLPSNRRQRLELNHRRLPGSQRHHQRPLGAVLGRVPTLHVAGIVDRWIAPHRLALVNVAQRPVGVAGVQAVQRGGGVAIVLLGRCGAHHLGVQQGYGRLRPGRERECRSQIAVLVRRLMPRRDHPSHHVALALDGDRPRLARRDQMEPLLRPADAHGPVVGPPRIVVAGGVDHRQSRAGRACQLVDQHALGREGQPLVVEEVPGKQQRIDLTLERQIHQACEGFTPGLAQPRAHVLVMTPIRRVEVHVGGVDKTKHASASQHESRPRGESRRASQPRRVRSIIIPDQSREMSGTDRGRKRITEFNRTVDSRKR